MSYDQGINATYRFPAAALATDGIIGRIIGPSGKKGRGVGVSSVVTTNVTVASADNDASFASHTVPVSSAGAALNGFTRGATEYVTADDTVFVSSDGGPTAGAGDVIVHVVWF